MTSFGSKHNVNAWFIYVLVCFGNKSMVFWFASQLHISATGSERGQKRGSNEARKLLWKPLSFSSSLPPARQQVCSRSLQAAWQHLSSSFHAARDDIPQPFSSSLASARQQPSCRPASAANRWIDATTLGRHPPGRARCKHVIGFAQRSHEWARHDKKTSSPL